MDKQNYPDFDYKLIKQREYLKSKKGEFKFSDDDDPEDESSERSKQYAIKQCKLRYMNEYLFHNYDLDKLRCFMVENNYFPEKKVEFLKSILTELDNYNNEFRVFYRGQLDYEEEYEEIDKYGDTHIQKVPTSTWINEYDNITQPIQKEINHLKKHLAPTSKYLQQQNLSKNGSTKNKTKRNKPIYGTNRWYKSLTGLFKSMKIYFDWLKKSGFINEKLSNEKLIFVCNFFLNKDGEKFSEKEWSKALPQQIDKNELDKIQNSQQRKINWIGWDNSFAYYNRKLIDFFINEKYVKKPHSNNQKWIWKWALLFFKYEDQQEDIINLKSIEKSKNNLSQSADDYLNNKIDNNLKGYFKNQLLLEIKGQINTY